MVFKVICLAVVVFGFSQASVIPETKCKLTDAACLKPAFQKMLPTFMTGIPDANVEVLDTMNMDDLAFDLSGLKFTMKEGTLKGLKNTVIENVDWDTKKKIINLDYYMEISVKGHYTADGKILILPITGDGQIKLKFKKLQMNLAIHYDVVKGKDGKEHIKPKKYTFKFEAKDGGQYSLTGLFNGNTELSDGMLKFLNENWKQVADEFGFPLIDSATKKLFKNIVNYFEATPLEDLTIA